MENKQKRVRRSDDQLLSEAITQLYIKIEQKISKIEYERSALEEVFDALRPLRSLEDQYRGNGGNKQSVE